MGVRGLNPKIEEQRFAEYGEMTAKNASIPSRNKKRRIDLKEQRDKQTDRQTESATENKTPRLWRRDQQRERERARRLIRRLQMVVNKTERLTMRAPVNIPAIGRLLCE